MTEFSLRLAILIMGFTLVSGFFDALAFTYSAKMWQGGKLIWLDTAKAAGSFAIGITMYWVAVRYLAQAGVVTAELQTLVWFGVTIVGVAVLNGRFSDWQVIDQLAAANAVLCIGWLVSRPTA